MKLKINRAAVLGAGVMGAQIAAHLAAAGVRTHLLDLTTNDEPADPKQKQLLGKNYRSARAVMAVENLKQLKPSPLVSANVLANIIPGNFDDDWSVLASVDWVIEAVVEKLDIKRQIHKRLQEVVRPHVPVTTNTSGIALAEICKDFPEHYQNTFFGTHFFNPPRYMRLVEIIPHADSDEKLVDALAVWIHERLGKGIVYASDTINFIANRIGVLAMQSSMKHMEELGLNIATVDGLTGTLVGRPKSATFRTMDVVGLDTYAHVAANVYNGIKSDPFHAFFSIPKWMQKLIEQGMLGQKTPAGGCYKKSKDAKGETIFLTVDHKTGTHTQQEAQNFPWMDKLKSAKDIYQRLALIFKENDTGAEFLWRIHRDVFSYSALLLEEIAHGSPKSLDEAICWGFNWESGPFQLWQGIGYDQVRQRMVKEGAKLPDWCKTDTVFYDPAPQSPAWRLTGPTKQLQATTGKMSAIKKSEYQFHLPRQQNPEDKRIVLGNANASLVDIGDDIACLVFHSKMNTLNDEIVDLTQKSIAKVAESFAGLVVANEGENFSAGAYLGNIVEMINKQDFASIDKLVRAFQGTTQLLKFAPFPTVAAPHGLVLGGGCEVSLHTSRSILACDTFAGLVEVGVGLIPAGGGTKELALRAYDYMNFADSADPMPFLRRAFMLIGMGRVSTSGQEAVEMGLFPNSTFVMLSRDHQILRAKHLVRELNASGYAPPTPRTDIAVVGDPGVMTFKLMLYNMVEGGQVSAYDAYLGEQVATILCGGTVDAGSRVSEQHFLDLERLAFVDLCRHEKTKDRIVHMLKSGKPLRN